MTSNFENNGDMPPSSFDLKTAPLKGAYLLEANAGTGKTFSLSGLFLKFLYFKKRLSVKNLVAITFTKAATQEIFSRIKKDLEKFLELITTHKTIPVEDDIKKFSFGYLLYDYYSLSPVEKKSKRDHLEKNLLNFDEHNIHTIHGFAGKIIREYQMELGITMGEEITENDAIYFEEAFRDFWRHHFLDIDPYFLAYFEKRYPYSKWKRILETFYRLPTLKPYPSDQKNSLKSWKNCLIRKTSYDRYSLLIKSWDEVQALFQDQIQDMSEQWSVLIDYKVMNKNKTKTFLSDWNRLEALIKEGRILPLLYDYFDTPKLIHRFTSEGIDGAFNKNYHSENYLNDKMLLVLEKMDRLVENLKSLNEIFQKYAFLLIHASRDYVIRRSWELRKKAGVLSYNDLLTILSYHIESKHGDYLIRELSKTFQVILIDEFQDTDPLQFSIFQRLLPHIQAMYFIADPKQSIYSFRQANIHTYFQAKEFMNDIFCLRVNYRSDPLLLDGINHIYTRHSSPFFIPKLNYLKSHSGVHEEDVIEKPLRIIFGKSKKSRSVEAKRSDTIDLLLKNIHEIINQGYRTAILVRKKAHGFLVHNRLRNFGIPSYMEDSDDPFLSQEARDLYFLMKAIVLCGEEGYRPIITYRDPRLLGALSTSFFLDKKIHSPYSDECEEILKNWLFKFQQAHLDWKEHGWYSMIHQFMKEASIPSRILGQEDGDERYLRLLKLIDFVHSWKYPSLERTLQRFTDSLVRKSPTVTNDSLLAKITQNEGVRISTIHKCKGLEYDVVFLPFLDEDLFPKNHEVIFKLKSETESEDLEHLGYDLGSKNYDEHKILSKQEILAEELRLLYVAMTRAKKICYLYISPDSKNYHKSSLGYLLHPEILWQYFQFHFSQSSGKKKEEELQEKLIYCKKELVSLTKHPSILFTDFSVDKGNDNSINALKGYHDQTSFSQTLSSFIPFAPSNGIIYSENFQTSFTSMTADFPHQESNPGEREEEQLDDSLQEISETILFNDPLTDFPRGTGIGLFLHEVLEKIDFFNSQSEYLKGIFIPAYKKYMGDHLKDKVTLAKVIGLLKDIQNLKLIFSDSPPFSLKDTFSQGKVVREMEFTLFFSRNEDDLINQIFLLLNQRQLIDNIEPQSLINDNNPFSLVFRKGFIKGFIDMVFCHGEKYYFLDWKSNFLGERPSDYNIENLYRVMIKEKYFLQAYLYTLALDRYLALRLGKSYDYDKHFGGFCYVFIRGIRYGGIFNHKPSLQTIKRLRKFL